jgi:hypothetical protein
LNPPIGLAREWKKLMGGNMTGIVPNPENPNEAVGYTQAAIFKTKDTTNWYDSSSLFTGYAASYPKGIVFDSANPDRFVTCNADVGLVYTENGCEWFYNIGVPKPWRTYLIPWTSAATAAMQPGTHVIITAVGDTFNKRLVRSNVSDWSGYDKSIDSDEYWQLCDSENNPLMNYWFIGFHPTETNMVFTENKYSDDAGITWTDIPFLTRQNASIIGMSHSSPGDPEPFFTLYAVNKHRNKLYRYDYDGVDWDFTRDWELYVETSWTMKGHDSKPIITVHPTNPDIIYALDRERDISMYDGESWHSLGIRDAAVDPDGPFNYTRAFAIDPRHPEVMYAGMALPGGETVWRSVDGGNTWENITRNLPRLAIWGFSISPHTGELFKGGVDGTYVLPPPYEEANNLIYDKCVDPAAYGTPKQVQTSTSQK